MGGSGLWRSDGVGWGGGGGGGGWGWVGVWWGRFSIQRINAASKQCGVLVSLSVSIFFFEFAIWLQFRTCRRICGKQVNPQ